MPDADSARFEGLGLTELLSLAPPFTRIYKCEGKRGERNYFRALFMYESTWQEVQDTSPQRALRGLLVKLIECNLWEPPE